MKIEEATKQGAQREKRKRKKEREEKEIEKHRWTTQQRGEKNTREEISEKRKIWLRKIFIKKKLQTPRTANEGNQYLFLSTSFSKSQSQTRTIWIKIIENTLEKHWKWNQRRDHKANPTAKEGTRKLLLT